VDDRVPVLVEVIAAVEGVGGHGGSLSLVFLLGPWFVVISD